jgi:hypothetical protein
MVVVDEDLVAIPRHNGAADRIMMNGNVAIVSMFGIP